MLVTIWYRIKRELVILATCEVSALPRVGDTLELPCIDEYANTLEEFHADEYNVKVIGVHFSDDGGDNTDGYPVLVANILVERAPDCWCPGL